MSASWLSLAFVLVFVIASMFGACAPPPIEAEQGMIEVEYRVAGALSGPRAGEADAGVTFFNRVGAFESRAVMLPWRYLYKASPGDSVFVRAHKHRRDGSITVHLFIDGERVETSASHQAFGVARVGGNVPKPLATTENRP